MSELNGLRIANDILILIVYFYACYLIPISYLDGPGLKSRLEDLVPCEIPRSFQAISENYLTVSYEKFFPRTLKLINYSVYHWMITF